MLSNAGTLINNTSNQQKVKAAIEAGIKRKLSDFIGLTGEVSGTKTSISEIIETVKADSVDDTAYIVVEFLNKRASGIRQQIITNLAANPATATAYAAYKSAGDGGDDSIMSRWIQQCYKDADKRYEDGCVINSIAPPGKKISGQKPDTPDTAALDAYRKWLLGTYKHAYAQNYLNKLSDAELRGLMAECGSDVECLKKLGLTEDLMKPETGEENGGGKKGGSSSYTIPGSPIVTVVQHRREAWR